MPPRIDVEQIVCRQGHRRLPPLAEGVPGERCIDHRVTVGRGLEIRHPILVLDPLELRPRIQHPALRLQPGQQPQRGNARDVAAALDRRPDIIEHAVRDEPNAARLRQPDRRLDLEPAMRRVALEIAKQRQVVLLEARLRLVDEVVEPVEIGGGVKPKAPAVDPEINFGAEALLGLEVGIAHLIGRGRDMRSVAEQFLGRRRAGGARQVEPDLARRHDRIADAGRARNGAKAANEVEETALHAAVIVAQRSLEPELVTAHFLQREDAPAVGLVSAEESLGPLRVEFAPQQLSSGHSAPAAPVSLDQFGPAFVAEAVEHRADLAALEFGVRIVGQREAGADLLEQGAAKLHVAAQVEAGLLHADPDSLGSSLFVASRSGREGR